MDNKKENKQKIDYIKKLKESYESGVQDKELIDRLKKINELAEKKISHGVKDGIVKMNPNFFDEIKKSDDIEDDFEKTNPKFFDEIKKEDEVRMWKHINEMVKKIKVDLEILKSDISLIEDGDFSYSEEFLENIKLIKEEFKF